MRGVCTLPASASMAPSRASFRLAGARSLWAGVGYRKSLNSRSDLTPTHSRVWRTSVKLLVKHFHFYSCSLLYSLGRGRFNPKDLFFFSLSLSPAIKLSWPE